MNTGPEAALMEYERFRRKKEPGRLTPTQAFVLHLIVKTKTTKERDLCGKGLSASSLSRALSALAKNGLIVRTVDREDARKHLFESTRSGEQELLKWQKHWTSSGIANSETAASPAISKAPTQEIKVVPARDRVRRKKGFLTVEGQQSLFFQVQNPIKTV